MAVKRITVEYFVYENANEFAQHAAELFATRIGQAVSKRGAARIAISGGNTPKPIFGLLSGSSFKDKLPWDKVQLYWVDERTVAPNSEDSNYGMTKKNLLDRVAIPEVNVFRMEGERDPQEAAARYESIIRNNMRLEGAELPTFDLVALGMGDDGHTASLFPHTEGLHELGRIVIANHVPQKDTWRLTLTAPVINQALDVVFLIQGADKAEPLSHVFQGQYDPETYPSQLIRPASGSLTLILDKAAAAKLPPPRDGVKGTLEVAR